MGINRYKKRKYCIIGNFKETIRAKNNGPKIILSQKLSLIFLVKIPSQTVKTGINCHFSKSTLPVTNFIGIKKIFLKLTFPSVKPQFFTSTKAPLAYFNCVHKRGETIKIPAIIPQFKKLKKNKKNTEP